MTNHLLVSLLCSLCLRAANTQGAGGNGHTNVTGPAVFVTNANDTRELSLTCQTDEPSAKFYDWLLPGTRLCPSQAGNTCIFRPRLKDDGENVTCIVENSTKHTIFRASYVVNLKYPPSTVPTISVESGKTDLLKHGDVITCTVSGGKPRVTNVTFHCQHPDLADRQDDVSDGGRNVSSTVTVETSQATERNMTCTCSALWEPEPELYSFTSTASFQIGSIPQVTDGSYDPSNPPTIPDEGLTFSLVGYPTPVLQSTLFHGDAKVQQPEQAQSNIFLTECTRNTTVEYLVNCHVTRGNAPQADTGLYEVIVSNGLGQASLFFRAKGVCLPWWLILIIVVVALVVMTVIIGISTLLVTTRNERHVCLSWSLILAITLLAVAVIVLIIMYAIRRNNQCGLSWWFIAVVAVSVVDVIAQVIAGIFDILQGISKISSKACRGCKAMPLHLCCIIVLMVLSVVGAPAGIVLYIICIIQRRQASNKEPDDTESPRPSDQPPQQPKPKEETNYNQQSQETVKGKGKDDNHKELDSTRGEDTESQPPFRGETLEEEENGEVYNVLSSKQNGARKAEQDYSHLHQFKAGSDNRANAGGYNALPGTTQSHACTRADETGKPEKARISTDSNGYATVTDETCNKSSKSPAAMRNGTQVPGYESVELDSIGNPQMATKPEIPKPAPPPQQEATEVDIAAQYSQVIPRAKRINQSPGNTK